MSKPIPAKVEEGQTYSICQCGKSEKLPFCDGSHVGTDKRPKPYTADKTGVVSFCGCGKSGSIPTCDGSHALKD